MTYTALRLTTAGVWLVVLLVGAAANATAQVIESTGSRALGMGGAFVAVANDNSATWWNPSGLANGPFLDSAISRASWEVSTRRPAHRDSVLGFALATPPFGFSVYRLQLTQIPAVDSTEPSPGDRQDRRIGAPVSALTAQQFGATVLQTLVTGVHAGTTLKYVRGTYRTAPGGDGSDRIDSLLDQGDDLSGGSASGHFDLDVGLLAVAGPVRLGGVVKNLLEPEFDAEDGTRMTLERQVRVGVAFDAEEAGGPPLMLALDADARAYDTGNGRRQVVAVGAEQWFVGKRLGVRAGVRVNTVGDTATTMTAGGSVALRSGLYLDGHVATGSATSERGWGAAARVSF